MKKILILGGTGMLGHVLFRSLSKNEDFEVYATTRDYKGLAHYFDQKLKEKIRPQIVEADNFDSVIRALASIQPNIVINCIGLIKQLPLAGDPLSAITINAQLPHRLSLICRTSHARLIHISTDCVFNGRKGMYIESDISDAEDLYGRTKYLGEVSYRPHCITLRTSIIGHELKGKFGLVEWFLSQKEKAKGFTKAIYSGFPTIELSKIISDYIIPNTDLSGVYHVSSEPISKYDLLKLVADRYNKKIQVEPFDEFVQDRSLNSVLFQKQTGYVPPSWRELVDLMYNDYIQHREVYDAT